PYGQATESLELDVGLQLVGLDAGLPQAGHAGPQVGLGSLLDSRHDLYLAGKRHDAPQRLHGLLTNHAGRLSGVRIAIDETPSRVRCAGADAGRSQGQGVQGHHVAACAGYEGGWFWGCFVKVPTVGMPSLLEPAVVVASALDPDAGRHLGRSLAHARDQFDHAPSTAVDLLRSQTSIDLVLMRVIEAGQE